MDHPLKVDLVKIWLWLCTHWHLRSCKYGIMYKIGLWNIVLEMLGVLGYALEGSRGRIYIKIILQVAVSMFKTALYQRVLSACSDLSLRLSA